MRVRAKALLATRHGTGGFRYFGPSAPQTFAWPLNPHVWPGGHGPQSTRPPQPSEMGPQFAPTCAHVRGVHASTQTPFEQDWAPWQSPQLGVRSPQPSATWPHVAPRSLHVRGAHGIFPHLPGTPPAPQPMPAGQSPHCTRPPQESALGPHSTPSSGHVFGVQLGETHWFWPLQKSPAGHCGHCTTPPH